MKCKKCGKDLSDDTKTCIYCGTDLFTEQNHNNYDIKIGNTLICKQCGRKMEITAMFCDGCGKKMITKDESHQELQEQNVPETNTLKCPRCGRGINSEDNYCDNCGFVLYETVSSDSNNHSDVLLICKNCGHKIDSHNKFCDNCGKENTGNEVLGEYQKNFSFNKKLDKKNIIVIISSLLVATGIILFPKNIFSSSNENLDIEDRDSEIAKNDISISKFEETETTSVSSTEVVPLSSSEEINYEETFRTYIKETLANYYGIASQNPFKQYSDSTELDGKTVLPYETLGLVASYISDFNDDDIPELLAISLVENDANYIWRAQCFTINAENQISQVSRYDFELDKRYHFKNNFMKIEQVDGRLVFSCNYIRVEGKHAELLFLNLSDLSLSKATHVKSYLHAGPSLTIDGEHIDCNIGKNLDFNQVETLGEEKMNEKTSEKLYSLKINHDRVSLCNEKDSIIRFENSKVLVDYQREGNIVYPKEYTSLYDLFGIEKTATVLEARVNPKNPDPDEKKFISYGYAYVPGNVLNLRYKPSTDSDILASIPDGTRLKLYSSDNSNWFYTVYQQKIGYVSSDYISFSSPETTSQNIVKSVQIGKLKGRIVAHGGEVASFTSDYVVKSGNVEKVNDNIPENFEITAKYRCSNYGIIWYEVWGTNDNKYYGWIDSYYIDFTTWPQETTKPVTTSTKAPAASTTPPVITTPKPSLIPETIPVTSQPPKNTAFWIDIYHSELEKYKSHPNSSDIMFDLVDINGDNVPELIVSVSEIHSSMVAIYTVSNNRATPIGYLNDSNNQYQEFAYGTYGTVEVDISKHIIKSYYSMSGICTGKYLSILDSKEHVNLTFESRERTISNLGIYLIDGIEVNEEEYYSKLEEYEGNYKSYGRKYKLSDDLRYIDINY